MAPTRHPFRRASSLRTTAADVRICARLSALGAPIRGHLKHVPSDFVVNELRGEDCSEVLLSEPRARAEQQAGDEADEADDEEAPALKRARGESVCAARLRTADESGSAHVRFTLHKIRRGTLEAIALLGAELKLPVRAFSVCGIKDAFAVTTQEVAVRGATAAELRAVQLPEVVVGDARPADGPMRIGGAAGNAFRIRIRGMRTTAAALERMADALRTNGFVNYYGLQRFGQGPVKSHELGRLLLRRDYAQLLETIVCAPAATADMLPSDEREPRAHFNFSRNAALALKSFPRRLRLERELLARLLRDEEHKEAGGSWNSRCRSAILSLPLSKRKLWANAYYSFVFNLCATERIARFGGAVVEGDLVIAGDARPAPGRAAVRISAHPPALVSADDVRTGRYSIHDVVLPLMGARVLTPRHEIGLLCRSYVGYDGIDTHTLEVRNSLQRPDGEADAEADGEEADGEEEAGEDEDEGAAGEGGHDGACGTDAEHADGAIGAIGDAGEDEDEDASGGGCWNHHGDYELRGSYRYRDVNRSARSLDAARGRARCVRLAQTPSLCLRAANNMRPPSRAGPARAMLNRRPQAYRRVRAPPRGDAACD
jgi:TruD family tRNA pseudouridine synthase